MILGREYTFKHSHARTHAHAHRETEIQLHTQGVIQHRCIIDLFCLRGLSRDNYYHQYNNYINNEQHCSYGGNNYDKDNFLIWSSSTKTHLIDI